ncbi:hypothetical protein ACVIGA_005941 [Bradyrhizobium sp. USDA 3240]
MDEAFAEVRASFDRFCLAAGIEALGTMMEADVVAGRATIARRRGGRTLGRTRGRIGFHGGKIEVERPRVRGVDGGEVTIPSWETAAQEDWLGRGAMNLMLINVRIYDVLKLRLRCQALIHGDETTVQVLKEKDKEASSTSYMWAYCSGEDSEQPIVLFDYQPGRGQEHPQTFLGDYRGILMSDGYSAWRTLKGATHIGCVAHARRRFVDALKARKKPGGLPAQALKFFDQLYRIERQVREEKPDDGETRANYRRRFRQQHSIPVLNTLKAWLEAIAAKVVPDTKLGDAVSYTLNQWEYLTRYNEDGEMPIHNNLLERDIRIFACGRKNWLFSDTVDGASASAVVYSLVLTCRACSVEPFAWLRHVLTELPQRARPLR